MALEAPLRSSTGSAIGPFSPHTDISASPDSPSVKSQYRAMSSASSVDSNSLRPSSAARQYNNNSLMSPSDIVGPSPVTSVGTEVTEIEDEVSEEVRDQNTRANQDPQPSILMLSTNIPDQVRQTLSEEAVSVIHAPESFQSWASTDSTVKGAGDTTQSSPRVSPKLHADAGFTPEQHHFKEKPLTTPNPPTLSTDVKPVRYAIDTPRAQNLEELQWTSESARLRSSSASSLELIPESGEPETDAEHEADPEDEDEELIPESEEDAEIRSLRTALQECWTLCNTLANLSTHHRERVFNSSGTPDGHEKAWKCCWKLCQRLYDNQDEDDDAFQMRMNLDLCRDFCQSLFDIRQRSDELADSVLRVSFELNNHLYSAQDNRTLPEAFRERTLDFYITLCHRLMKQRSELSTAEETDSLLKACWSLAEMLFSLRQNRRDGRPPDDELLGSAVQACWELCDIFRAGWTQIRPDRGTPRPTQATFFGGGGQQLNDNESRAGASSRASNRSHKRDSMKPSKPKPLPVPETPVTEFEDTPVSPESQSPQAPNILVLGTESTRSGRWSSNASQLSGYSQSSQRTSSTATTATTADDPNINRIKILILKAAMNVGFSRVGLPDGQTGAASLQMFVKSLPTGSFGSLPSHAALLQSYKNLVLSDSSFRKASSLPTPGKRVLATDVAKSVNWMTHRSSQYGFLRDLFRLVFGFNMDEAESRKNLSIAV